MVAAIVAHCHREGKKSHVHAARSFEIPHQRGHSAGRCRRVTGIYTEFDTELRRRHFSGESAGDRTIAHPHAVLVPNEVLVAAKRDLDAAGTGGTGSNYLVGTRTTGYISPFENLLAARRLGATYLPGLVGNISIPRQTANTGAYWLADETTQITESNPTIGQVSLSPKNVAARTEYSKQLLMQSTPRVDALLASELTKRLAAAIDVAVFAGAGNSGQPHGIVDTSNVGSVTGTSLAAAGIVEFQTDVAAASGVDTSECAYATTPAVAGLLMARTELPSTGTTRLWQGTMTSGQLLGLPAVATANCPAATMLFGHWPSVVIGEWGAIEVLVNPFADFTRGILGIRAWATVDIALRYPTAFSVAASIT